MDKAETKRWREHIEQFGNNFDDEFVLSLLDHIDALEQMGSEVVACWGKIYPDADANKIGITQEELEDMEFGPVNSLRKLIAAAPEPQE